MSLPATDAFTGTDNTTLPAYSANWTNGTRGLEIQSNQANGLTSDDTALQTELTTEYNPNSTRATGTQSRPTSDVYRTVATNTLDSGTPAVTEAGVLSQAATGGGVLLDRFTFAAINLVGANGDGLQTTVNLTLPAGS